MTGRRRAAPGIVVGLAAEARLLGHADASWVRCAAGDRARAAGLGRALAAAGAPALVSFGIAGGLDPRLTPGTLVLATEVVVHGGEATPTDAAWRARVRAALAPALVVVEAPVLGTDAVLLEPAAKAEEARRSGAAAADMESHGVADAARAAGLPLLVLRAIADPAAARLPRAVGSALEPDGRVRSLAVLAAAFRTPSELGNLLRLARAAGAARSALRGAVDRLGPGFGFA